MKMTQKLVRKHFRDVARAAMDVEAAYDEGTGALGDVLAESLARLNAALGELASTSFVIREPSRLPVLRRAHG